jgi:uncharacterized damage-inducible protein DinB
MSQPNELFVKMVVDAWTRNLKTTNELLDKLTDDELMREVSPGRNRGIYLLGHLTAVHDEALRLLRFQAELHPGLKAQFIDAPDGTIANLPSLQQLREQWKNVNATLMGHIDRLSADEWFTRHASISEEDFAKEPHRNRLNLLIGRITHLVYHRGQLVLLESKG